MKRGLIYSLLAIGVVFLIISNQTEKINNFDGCEKAGYPVMESYPRQCKTPDDRTFTETIKNEFCGSSTFGTCSDNSKCITGGCSGQVCQSNNEESVITTCEYTECYDSEKFNVKCKCVNKQCQWD